MEHTPWTARIDANLKILGIDKATRDAIKTYRDRLCQPPDESPRLVLSPRAQARLFQWGISPQDTFEIVEYIDALNELALGSADPEKETRERNKAQKAKWRDNNRDAYNAYQKDYMAKRNAAKRTKKATDTARTAPARAARWPQSPNTDDANTD